MSANRIRVRNACRADFPALAAMEEAVWNPEGVETLGITHFNAWLEWYPEGFFVATEGENDTIIGFASIEVVNFNLAMPLPSKFSSFTSLTNNGLIIEAHEPAGSHHFGVTICSQQKGGAHHLLRAILDLCNARQRPLLGAARMPGLTNYLTVAREKGCGESLAAVALHYVLSCVSMAQGRAHPSMYVGYRPEVFPPVAVLDPVLKSYLRHPEFVFYRLLPGFLHDSKSQDYAVLFGQEVCT